MDPFADVEDSGSQVFIPRESNSGTSILPPKEGFDWEAYRKWWVEDEKLLIECLMKRPGLEGCRLYETERRGFIG